LDAFKEGDHLPGPEEKSATYCCRIDASGVERYGIVKYWRRNGKISKALK
jgi:hypothetical protein